MTWLEKIRAWPQRKKMNYIWSITGAAILVMIGIWILVGNYRSNSTDSASGTIGSLVTTIKNSK